MVNLIRVLIKYSSECNIKLKADSSLICQMDNDMFELVGVHEKLGAVSSYNMELLRNWNEVLNENEAKDKKIKELEEEGQVSSTTECKDTKLKKELDEQLREVDRLKGIVRDSRTSEVRTTRTI